MRVAPVSAETIANRRIIVSSFIAGVAAMAVVGLLAPVAAQSALTVQDADARTFEQSAPAIAPLDVDAIEAALAEAERDIAAGRNRSDAQLARLARISR